jgi:CheY-like chemotaxis protein
MSCPRSILVADDEDTFLQSTARLLRRDGYDCECAPNADRAIDLLHAHRYDLLIADIKMPGNTDLRLVQESRQLAAGMPVILVTGYPSLDTAIRSVQLPVVAYLTKPIDPGQLLAEVRTAMEQSHDYTTVLGAHRRLENCLREIEDLEAGLRPSRSGAACPAAPALLNAAVQSVAECLAELGRLWQALLPAAPPPNLCRLVCCGRRDILEGALRDAVETIERTKHAFKSKELGSLRARLEESLKKVAD